MRHYDVIFDPISYQRIFHSTFMGIGDVTMMKKNRNSVVIPIAIICILLNPLVFVATKSGEGRIIGSNESVEATMEYNYSFSAPIITESAGVHHVEIADTFTMSSVGNPILPYRALKILLPPEMTLSDITVEHGQEKYIEGSYHLDWAKQPRRLPGTDGGNNIKEHAPTSRNENMYTSHLPFPGTLFKEVSIQYFRGYPVLYLNLYPVHYIPAKQCLYYYQEISIKINITRNRGVNRCYRSSTEDLSEVLNMVDNGESIKAEYLGSYQYPALSTWDMVIITNNAFNNSSALYTFQDLADYRTSKGIKTTIITVEDIYASYPGVDNSEKIRNFIISAYNNWGIEYVLLGGDADRGNVGGESGDLIVPTRLLYCDDYIASDLYYACLDGDYNNDGDGKWGEPNDGPGGGDVDMVAEVYVGRAPVDSDAELSNFVRKTL